MEESLAETAIRQLQEKAEGLIAAQQQPVIAKLPNQDSKTRVGKSPTFLRRALSTSSNLISHHIT
jgi:hypothetical protein